LPDQVERGVPVDIDNPRGQVDLRQAMQAPALTAALPFDINLMTDIVE
jgi:hypothetical protein